MPNLDQDEKNRLFMTMDSIHRGIYGDEQNGHPGLLHEVNELKKWRDSINYRIAYMTGGFAIVCFLIEMAIQIYSHH